MTLTVEKKIPDPGPRNLWVQLNPDPHSVFLYVFVNKTDMTVEK